MQVEHFGLEGLNLHAMSFEQLLELLLELGLPSSGVFLVLVNLVQQLL